MKPTRTQRLVLHRLAARWVMDRAGCNGLGAVLFNSRTDPAMTINEPTVSALLREGWIETSLDGIRDFDITRLGLEAAGIQPAERKDG